MSAAVVARSYQTCTEVVYTIIIKATAQWCELEVRPSPLLWHHATLIQVSEFDQKKCFRGENNIKSTCPAQQSSPYDCRDSYGGMT